MSGHLPVLLEETVEMLGHAVFPEGGTGRILDGTFGGGGHTRALLERLPACEILALDADPEAIRRAEPLREEFPHRFGIVHANFKDLADIETGPLAGALFDLGLSSFQFDDAERGFAFRLSGPVDMRLNPGEGLSAAEFLETAPREALVRAVREYGEETRWRRVVDAIMAARGTGKLAETTELAELVKEAVGMNPRRPHRIHPATQTFQGIRIAVNAELEALETVLPVAFERLAPGGVLAVISFHSLEDRIVKRFCKRMAGRPEHGRDSRPQQERVVRAELLTRRATGPSETETDQNPRARSAKLRAIKKL